MIPGFPALGVRFDIGKVGEGGGAYGFEAWKVFWHAVDPTRLGTALLYEGDTAATLSGSENVFCIAVQADEGVLQEARTALERRDDFRRAAASPAFVEGVELISEPLPGAGKVDAAGNLLDASWAESALKAVRAEGGAASRISAMTVPDRIRKAKRAEIDDLESLKGRLELLPSRCPPTATVVGPGVEKANEQIPIICRNIDDAVRALTTGRDPNGNPITELEVADGLTNLIQFTRDPGFVGGISLALSMEGIMELTKEMDELAGITAKLRPSASPSASEPEPSTGPAITLWFEDESEARRFLTEIEDPETRQRVLPEALGKAMRDPSSDTSAFVEEILNADAGQGLTLSSSARQNADRGGYDVTLVLGPPSAAEVEELVAEARSERAKAGAETANAVSNGGVFPMVKCSVCGSSIRQLDVMPGLPSAMEQWFANVCTSCRKVYCSECLELGGPTPCPTCGEPTKPAQRMHLEAIGLNP